LLITQKGTPLFHLVWHVDTLILLHDCQENRGYRLNSSAKAPKFLIPVYLSVHSTSAANRMWSAFVPLRRMKFNIQEMCKDTAIISRTYLYN